MGLSLYVFLSWQMNGLCIHYLIGNPTANTFLATYTYNIIMHMSDYTCNN